MYKIYIFLLKKIKLYDWFNGESIIILSDQ